MKKVLLALLIFCSGCITTTQQISVIPAQNWERRYTNNDTIIINNQQIILNKNETLWILKSETLNTLIRKSVED